MSIRKFLLTSATLVGGVGVVSGGGVLSSALAQQSAQAPAALEEIVVTARKGDKSPLTLHPGLILHGPDGGFTEAVQGILRQAKGCALGRGATQRRKARNATRE